VGEVAFEARALTYERYARLTGDGAEVRTPFPEELVTVS
jgi:hypothetical protein